MQSPETRYVARPDGVSIAYQVFGAGPDLLVAPGLASHLDLAWADPDLARLFRRLATFARVIVFDKPGTGLSDPILHVPTLEERRDDILLLLDAASSQRTSLLGLLRGWLGLPRASRHAPRSRPSWGQGKLIDYYAPSVASRLQRSTFATFERAAASPALIRGVIEATRQIDVRGVLEAVSVPALVLHHADDIIPVFNARILADGIPGAELRILPGRDHMFWVSDFEESVREIERFVAGSRGSASREQALATIVFTDIVGSTNAPRRWATARGANYSSVTTGRCANKWPITEAGS